MTEWEILAVLAAGLVAGGVNALVGAGTLVTFSTLVLLGVPPLTANVTNTVGLVAGSVAGSLGYRPELTGQRSRLRRLGPASLLGGLVGAGLLLVLPSAAFDAIVPALILLGVVLVVLQPRLSQRLAEPHRVAPAPGPVLWGGVFLAGIYGGYFGAAQGVILIALMGILLDRDLQRVNAMKNVLAAVVNGVAALVFVFAADIDWMVAGLLVVSTAAGGWTGARVGRRLPVNVLRTFIVVVGLAAVVVLLAR
ncbi:MAG: sulfite exporter TauE/SafE family protein [Actinomycetota bacterium]|nr:sulfite exporter TauE/SafE family protein [Gemmatimonadota bacterium]MDH4353740.1 sulfite exporter TauE/SafE family protein [Actinomycetota bacterium]MDH5277607.1 sulfite exporter TauE/SafE family protein [Actinomycetota bacterium]